MKPIVGISELEERVPVIGLFRVTLEFELPALLVQSLTEREIIVYLQTKGLLPEIW